MRRPTVQPTGREVTFGEDELIVSKTDLAGVVTYANDVFLRVSGYSEVEIIGKPHNIIRHPDMPRTVFKLLWDTIQSGEEIFAYVVNLAKNGDHYWVFAHVTPSVDAHGAVVGYHSSRRVPYPDALPKVRALYKTLCDIERSQPDPRSALEAGTRAVHETLAAKRCDYSQFVFSLSERTAMDLSV
ncbi:MAG: PAS domain-containing protein [Phycisphaerae bacterium]|nr:PAS domain-containing protein [Phycisphaerae bacterium]